MKARGMDFYKSNTETNKRYFEDAKQECNDFIKICMKRGYNYNRFREAELSQGKLAF